MRLVRLPCVEIPDEVRQRVLPAMGRLVLLRRASEPRGVARELAQRDLANVAALLQLGHVFGDGIVERDFALLDRLRQQGGDEGLADRGEIEQRVRGDRRFARDVGHAVVEQQRAAVDRKRHRHAAGGNEHRLHVAAHELLDLGFALAARHGLGSRRGVRIDDGCCGERCASDERCRRECSGDSHRVPPVIVGSAAPTRGNSTAPAPRAELIRVHINSHP
jgi:hypothetical protein